MSTLSTERTRSTTPNPSDELLEQIARTTDLRWQAVLHYVRTITTTGGKVRLAFDGDRFAELLRFTGVPVGGDIAYLSREDEAGVRQWDAIPAEHLDDTSPGDWILHGWRGSEDLWQVVGAYRYVCAVTNPDVSTEQVHVLLRLEA